LGSDQSIVTCDKEDTDELLEAVLLASGRGWWSDRLKQERGVRYAHFSFNKRLIAH
jgi:hypothetical protein